MYAKFVRANGRFSNLPCNIFLTDSKKYLWWEGIIKLYFCRQLSQQAHHHSSNYQSKQTSHQLFNLQSGICRSGIERTFRTSLHNWKRQMDINEARRKTIPKLVYLHNPWKYFLTKLNLFKLKALWDHSFVESDFIAGSKQAAVVLTNIIRLQNTEKISKFTTPVGFQQITRDMLLSRNDSRLKLVRFETEHLRRAIPMKVATRNNFGRKYAFIDMLFVGLRNTKDFESPEEAVEINDILRKMDEELKTPAEVLAVPHRIVFAEIFIRFRRDYTDDGAKATAGRPEDKDWSVSFYKILTFDVLNYDPNPQTQT